MVHAKTPCTYRVVWTVPCLVVDLEVS